MLRILSWDDYLELSRRAPNPITRVFYKRAQREIWVTHREDSEVAGMLEWCGWKPRNADSSRSWKRRGANSPSEPLEGECSPADTCFLGLLQQIATDWVTAGDKFVSQFWRLDGAREGVFLVFPSFWGLLAIPGVLWFCNCITPVSTSIVTHPFPLPMTVSKFSSYRYTSHWIRAMLIQYDLMLTWLHLRRHFFYIRLHSQVLGVRTWLHLFGKCSSTHNRVYGWLPQWLRIWEQRNYLRLVQSAKDDSFWIWDSLGDRADKNWR